MKKPITKKVFLLFALVLACLMVFKNCSFHTLPKERLSAFKIEIDESYVDGQFQISFKNPVDCPLRFYLSCQDSEVNDLLNARSPLLLSPKTDTSINISNKGDLTGEIDINIKWGDPELPINTTKISSLPYPKGNSYELLQGNNSNPTHNHSVSRYAFDFTLDIGDTIASAQDGFVIGVIDGYH